MLPRYRQYDRSAHLMFLCTTPKILRTRQNSDVPRCADLKENEMIGLTPADLAIVSQEAGLVSFGLESNPVLFRSKLIHGTGIWSTSYWSPCLPLACHNHVDCHCRILTMLHRRG
jgi:hypothetical protein